MIENKLHEVMEVCALYLGYKPTVFLEFLSKGAKRRDGRRHREGQV